MKRRTTVQHLSLLHLSFFLSGRLAAGAEKAAIRAFSYEKLKTEALARIATRPSLMVQVCLLFVLFKQGRRQLREYGKQN